MQFNHLFKAATESDMYTADPDIYTALCSICVTPAFLAKLTDVKRHAHVLAALQRRSASSTGGCLPGNARQSHPMAMPAWRGEIAHHLWPILNVHSEGSCIRRLAADRPGRVARSAGTSAIGNPTARCAIQITIEGSANSGRPEDDRT